MNTKTKAERYNINLLISRFWMKRAKLCIEIGAPISYGRNLNSIIYVNKIELNSLYGRIRNDIS